MSRLTRNKVRNPNRSSNQNDALSDDDSSSSSSSSSSSKADEADKSDDYSPGSASIASAESSSEVEEDIGDDESDDWFPSASSRRRRRGASGGANASLKTGDWIDVSEDDPGPREIAFTPRGPPGPDEMDGLNEDSPALEYFKLLFTDEIIDEIVDEINRYADEKIGACELPPRSRLQDWIPVTVREFHTFLGIIINMGIIRLPSVSMYWTYRWTESVPFFRDSMSSSRFLLLYQTMLQVCRSEPVVPGDPPRGAAAEAVDAHKITPFIDRVVTNYQRYYNPYRELLMSQVTIGYRGRIAYKQHCSKKPYKWGLVMRTVTCPHTGYLLNANLYCGRNDDQEIEAGLSAKGQAVLDIVKPFANRGHHVYCDYTYSSIPLALSLYDKKFHFTATIRLSSVGVPSELKYPTQMRPGDVYAYRNGDVLILNWYDKSIVSVISTLGKAHEKNLVIGRRKRTEKPVRRPSIITSEQPVNRPSVVLSEEPVSKPLVLSDEPVYKPLFYSEEPVNNSLVASTEESKPSVLWPEEPVHEPSVALSEEPKTSISWPEKPAVYEPLTEEPDRKPQVSSEGPIYEPSIASSEEPKPSVLSPEEPVYKPLVCPEEPDCKPQVALEEPVSNPSIVSSEEPVSYPSVVLPVIGRSEHSESPVYKPSVVCEYNKHISRGIYLREQLNRYYNNSRKSIVWWKKVFFWMVESCISNAFILKKLHSSSAGGNDRRLTLLKFRQELVEQLVPPPSDDGPRSKRGRPSQGPPVQRLDGRFHAINKRRQNKQCKVCSDRAKGERHTVSTYCETCRDQPALHAIGCFERYHTELNYR
ncbi:uncharacterized protein LOC141912046 [Tubulanus polymorphus]|uniref:uncharacterized protein LOC141912046 n=1 Tax=Tubulanus polymorphus TaxID=672921 RepID=UPI003DA4F182